MKPRIEIKSLRHVKKPRKVLRSGLTGKAKHRIRNKLKTNNNNNSLKARFSISGDEKKIPQGKNSKQQLNGYKLRCTPWCDSVELSRVYHDFYAPLGFDSATGTFSIDLRKSSEISWQRVLERIVLWKRRCGNMSQLGERQFLLPHLTTLESLLVILLEEFRCQTDSESEGPTARRYSHLYQLYSIGVINFGSVLSSYSEDAGGVVSIRKLARYLDCPEWIVSLRHTLSHPTHNPPPMAQLHMAISFALQWFDRHFWVQMLPKATPPIEELHHLTCLILFSSPLKRQSKEILKTLETYIAQRGNEFLELFASILVHETHRHTSSSIQANLNIPFELLQRCARIFRLLMTSGDRERFILLLLDLLVEKIGILQELEIPTGSEEDHTSKLYSSYAWLLNLLTSLDSESTKTNSSNPLAKCFSPLITSGHQFKTRHPFAWFRLFHRLVRLQPVSGLTPILLNRVRGFLDPTLVPEDRFKTVLRLIEAYSGTLDETGSGLMETGSDDDRIKTRADLEALAKKTMPGKRIDSGYATMNNELRWSRIMLGASLPRRTLLEVPEEPEVTKSNHFTPEVITIDDD